MLRFSNIILGVGVAISLAIAPATVMAQDADDYAAEIEAASDLGARIYAYDQAAWHATDSFFEDIEDADDLDRSELRGFLVFPGAEDGVLDTVFFGEFDGELKEAARYGVRGSDVVSGGVIAAEDRPALSQEAIRMAEARIVAASNMRELEYGICANSSANTVVFPPDLDGNITVFILTPPSSNFAYPLGGHYRFTVNAEGELAGSRRYLNSCLAMQFGDPNSDRRPVAAMASHILDPYPTEIHFFVSHYLPIDLFVSTVHNELLWKIGAGNLIEGGDLSEMGLGQ